MGRADSIQRRLDNALNRTVGKGPLTNRTAYKRFVTRTGGDSLIGRPGSVTTTDTMLSPQPIYSRLSRYVVGKSSGAAEILGAQGAEVAEDLAIILSPSAITLAELQNPDLLIVFKDSLNGETVFKVTDLEPTPFQGQDVTFLAYIKNVKRP